MHLGMFFFFPNRQYQETMQTVLRNSASKEFKRAKNVTQPSDWPGAKGGYCYPDSILCSKHEKKTCAFVIPNLNMSFQYRFTHR